MAHFSLGRVRPVPGGRGTAEQQNNTKSDRKLKRRHSAEPLIARCRRQPAKQIAAPSVHNSSHQFRPLILFSYRAR